MAVGFPAKTTYADGDVFSASDINDTNGTLNLVSPATTSTVQSNPVLNSAFQIWQRGTSITANGTYSADRWFYSSASSNATITRQATSDTTNLPFIQYCARVQRNSGSTGTSDITLTQSMESINSIPFAGRVITLSFYARVGANYSGGASGFISQVRSGTGTDQNLQTGYTGSSSFISNSQALTTTWTRYSYTGTVPTNATEIGIYTGYTPTGTAGSNDYYEITGVQINVGSVALPFRTNGATIQGELAACQRYYYVLADGATQTFGTTGYFSSSDVLTTVFYPVTMRTAPTFSAASGSFYEVVRNGGANALSGLSSNFISTRTANVFAGSGQGASGTAGHAGQYRTTNASANIAFSAEL
jgi:hypothetical protein